MATLKDIATKCNISVSSVSRVINGDTNLSISEDKRILILKTAEELGYESSKLRAVSKHTIGLLTSYTSEEEIIDPYYLMIRVGIEDYCKDNNIELIRIYENELNKFLNNKLDGIIILGQVGAIANSRVKKLAEHIVTVDFHDKELNATSVDIDFTQTMIDLFEYFKLKNYHKLGLFAGQDEEDLEDIRTTLFKQYAKQYQMELKTEHILSDSFSLEGGFAMANQLIAQNSELPDLVFCENDMIAIGAIKAFHDNQVVIPDDIAIVGFNDIPTSSFITPTLSTVTIPMKEMGRKAAKVLIEKITNEESINSKIYVQTTLTIRESTN